MSKKADLQDRRRWGIPDWRDSKAYPVTLPDELWRWEFLRRRKDYREDWEREYRKTVKWYGEHSFKEWMTNNLTAPGPIQPGNFDCDPENPEFIVWWKHSIRKYRMPTLINPAVARPRHLEFWSIHLIEAGDWVFAPMALALDPAASLGAHIKILRLGLQMLQKQTGGRARKRCTKWANDLRVYDGRKEGVPFATIGEILRPDLVYSDAAKYVRDCYEAAKKFIEPFPTPPSLGK